MAVAIRDLEQTVERALRLDKRAVASLIGLFEDSRPEATTRRRAVMAQLRQHKAIGSPIVGFTGTPGSGKSSLLGRVVPALVEIDDHITVAVVAVDPSSHVSRGSLLGDRTRIRFAVDERRTYFRSQATATELGGLGPDTYQVVRLLRHLFDCVIVETVGIGQNELDIRYLADHVFLVIQPLGGDEIQYLKAGIIEIPDRFIVNKADDPAARQTFRQLSVSMSLARPFDAAHPPMHLTSARTGEGIDEVARAVLAMASAGSTAEADTSRDRHFLRRWVNDEWGRAGLRAIEGVGGIETILRQSEGFDAAQDYVNRHVVDWLRYQGENP